MNTLKLTAINRIARSLRFKKLNAEDQEKIRDIEFLLRRLRLKDLVEKEKIIKCKSYYK